MGNTRVIEIAVGLFVAIGLAALFTLAMQVSGLTQVGNGEVYRLTAYFDNVGGLKPRAPVNVSGVRVGRVASVSFDAERFQAAVVLEIDAEQDFLPTDTFASIHTSGLLGEQYVSLQPGAEMQTLSDGDVLRHTQSALVLEELVGKFLSNMSTQ